MYRYRIVIALLGTILIMTAGCGGGTTLVDTPQPATGDNPPAIEDATGYPAFPQSGMDVAPARRVSDEDFVVNGDGYTYEHGSLSRDGDNNSFVLISSYHELAWAWYSVPGLTGDRPVSITIDVEAAELTEGDGTDLPLYYWVGVSDFTKGGWEFFGQYAATETITINSSEINERFVDAVGTLHFFVLVPPAPTDGGHFAAQVNTGTVTTAPGYLQNKPHYVRLNSIHTGDPDPGRGTSAITPEQYVYLGWTHVAPFGAWDEDNAADTYEVFRRASGRDAQWEMIGSVAAPTVEYCDPSDNDPGVSDPLPCERYHYSVKAVNEAGSTLRYPRSVFIPLGAPTDVSATDGDFDEKIVLSWTKSDGATGYQIFQTNTENPLATVGDVDTWDDETIFPHVEYTYWVKATKDGFVSDLSDSDTGHAGVLFPPLDPPTDVSATDGDHADKVVLTWTKAENAVGYDIYRDDISGAAFANVGDVDSWEDTAASPGTVYTYWIISLQVEYSSDFSDPDTGYAGQLPDNPDLVCYPEDCYPDTDCLNIIHADPVVRRIPDLYYDPIGGGLVPVDEDGFSDILKTNGYEFTLEAAGGIWPRVAVVQTADPANIRSISDGMPGVLCFNPSTHRLKIDISVITVPGNPGDPDLPYSYKVFNSDGSVVGSGTFTYHPQGSAVTTPVGVNWGVNVWDREAGEIADRNYTGRNILSGATIGIDSPTPDVLWFEFTDGWYFEAETEVDSTYGSMPAEASNVLVRFEDTATAGYMYCGIAPVIAGLSPQGTIIAIHSTTILDFSNTGFPGWPGVFEPGHSFEVSLEDPHTGGIDYVYTTELVVTGPNPNDV